VEHKDEFGLLADFSVSRHLSLLTRSRWSFALSALSTKHEFEILQTTSKHGVLGFSGPHFTHEGGGLRDSVGVRFHKTKIPLQNEYHPVEVPQGSFHRAHASKSPAEL
jgi:hypothetical protein